MVERTSLSWLTKREEAPAVAPEPVKEPTLSLEQTDLRPGLAVHVICENTLPGEAELVVEAPQLTWRQYVRDAAAGFKVTLPVAGTYRLDLRQPRENGEGGWRGVAGLTVEVPE